jgi:hypothetical protein
MKYPCVVMSFVRCRSLSLALNQATLCHKHTSTETRALRERKKQAGQLQLRLSEPSYLNPGRSPPVKVTAAEDATSTLHPSIHPSTSTAAESSVPFLTSDQLLLSFLGTQYMRLLKSGEAGQPMEPLLTVKLLLAFVELKHHPGVGSAGLMVSLHVFCPQICLRVSV